MPVVVFADSDENILWAVSQTLFADDADVELITVAQASDAVVLRGRRIDLFVLDLDNGERLGICNLINLALSNEKLRFVVLKSALDDATVQDMSTDDVRYIAKPIELNDIKNVINRMLSLKRDYLSLGVLCSIFSLSALPAISIYRKSDSEHIFDLVRMQPKNVNPSVRPHLAEIFRDRANSYLFDEADLDAGSNDNSFFEKLSRDRDEDAIEISFDDAEYSGLFVHPIDFNDESYGIKDDEHPAFSSEKDSEGLPFNEVSSVAGVDFKFSGFSAEHSAEYKLLSDSGIESVDAPEDDAYSSSMNETKLPSQSSTNHARASVLYPYPYCPENVDATPSKDYSSSGIPFNNFPLLVNQSSEANSVTNVKKPRSILDMTPLRGEWNYDDSNSHLSDVIKRPKTYKPSRMMHHFDRDLYESNHSGMFRSERDIDVIFNDYFAGIPGIEFAALINLDDDEIIKKKGDDAENNSVLAVAVCDLMRSCLTHADAAELRSMRECYLKTDNKEILSMYIVNSRRVQVIVLHLGADLGTARIMMQEAFA